MPRIVEKVRKCLETGGIDGKTAAEVIGEVTDLQQRADELEEALIMLVRTGSQYENIGDESDSGSLRESFVTAMKEARAILGLEHRSVLTRTEPRT